jgi:hypothetical protein
MIQRRTHFPDALFSAITAYADAIVRGDKAARARLVTTEPQTQESNRINFERAARLGPWHDFELIARARLGLQYIAKVRFHGDGGELTLQCRWRDENGMWRIAEVADVGMRSPWLKLDAAETAGDFNA